MLSHCNLGAVTSTGSVWYKNTEQSMLAFDLDILNVKLSRLTTKRALVARAVERPLLRCSGKNETPQ